MKFKGLTFLTLLTIASSSFAVSGNPETNLREGGPESVCRILIRDAQNTLTSICSGTLVAPNRVLTAEHCQAAGQHMIVECGFQGVETEKLRIEKTLKGSKVYTSGVSFKESATAQVFYSYPKQDQLVLELDHALNIKPMGLKQNRMIHPDDECVVAGFGRTNSGFAGVLHTGVVEDIGESSNLFILPSLNLVQGLSLADIPMENGDVMMFFRNPAEIQFNQSYNAFVTPGDSGGAMLCKEAGGDWALTAVNIMFSFTRSATNLLPAFGAKSQTTILFMSNSTFIETPVKQAISAMTAATIDESKAEQANLPEGAYIPRKMTAPIVRALSLDRP